MVHCMPYPFADRAMHFIEDLNSGVSQKTVALQHICLGGACRRTLEHFSAVYDIAEVLPGSFKEGACRSVVVKDLEVGRRLWLRALSLSVHFMGHAKLRGLL
jgi:hypothetical protein